MTDRPAPPKDPDAYRTISEVAEDLGLPQHVLRFWETRFPQVRPLKRAGGRRFYRPEDVSVLRAVQVLLYRDGYTIKGVQRLLGEYGARQVGEALARSWAGPAAAPGARPGHGEMGEVPVAAGPDAATGSRSDPAAEPPRPAPNASGGLPVAKPWAAPAPAAQSSTAPGSAGRPPATALSADALAARLADVLAELDGCTQLLSTTTSTRN